ncbi:RtcB family protein [Paracraurococcus ruber]|uniref:3'-phosphate/5'-hydroxy nucleic acid ligase n=2 Tax=Paracraurococcus ruber TaxID=77675 RepID=A0ABS1CTD2_9PROT|nr:RNA-splicing ligase RtcB [Paracraurococcus ruber]TDG32508.1 RtcB family protein [Paracraurococcus ruber]
MTTEETAQGRRPDPLEARARALALAAGLDPDSRIPHESKEGRTMPAWVRFRTAARTARQAEIAEDARGALAPQPAAYRDSPLTVFGAHEQATLDQMRNCMAVGRAVAGVVCADGHLGYAQPVGGVIAYEGQVSISGVGFDIACGNMAVRLDTPFAAIRGRLPVILSDITGVISFGVGRANAERVQHPVLDDDAAWQASGMADYRQKAAAQLGTVGSGNHYVDLFEDEAGLTWIGVHFGSRGLGHTSATRYLKLAGGKDGMHVPPAVVEEEGKLGQRYLAAMDLAGRYAYAGREWVVERVRRILGGAVTDSVHNHHNFAWRERHGGRDLWVVRKGATPASPGQRGFVGGSMGDDAVILEGVESPAAAAALYSTVHGAGCVFGRKEAIRRFTRPQMEAWLQERGALLAGGGLDESPMAYRRLPEVLARHEGTVRVLHRLRPVAVAMAGEGEFDPFKD